MEATASSRIKTHCLKAGLIIGAFLSYIFAVSLNAVLNIPGVSPFNQSIGNLSHKYDTGITPSDATFAIWGLIYLWQLVIVIYGMTLLCRNSQGIPLYVSPGFIPSAFFLSYIVNLIGNPAWIFVFLEERNVPALGLLLLGVVTLIICLMSSCSQLDKCGADMVKKGLQADIWCTRIIVQNGIALYLAWVSCATSINTVVVLHYNLGVQMSCACVGALAVLTCVLLGWFVLETFLYDRQLRYVFGHYIAYIIAFVGIYKARYNPEVAYTIYEVVLLGIISAMALAKLIIIIVRSVRDPIHYPTKGDHFKFDRLPSEEVVKVAY